MDYLCGIYRIYISLVLSQSEREQPANYQISPLYPPRSNVIISPSQPHTQYMNNQDATIHDHALFTIIVSPI